MLLRYKGPSAARRIAGAGVVKKDEPAEIPDEIAHRLMERAPDSWEKVSEAKPPRRTNPPADDAGGGE
jgi:hypothetical protein